MFGMGTGVSPPLSPPETVADCQKLPAERKNGNRAEHLLGYGVTTPMVGIPSDNLPREGWSSPRLISTGGLHPLPDFYRQPIDVVLFHEPYPVNLVGGLILRRASHLDAFSAYLIQT